MEKRLEIIRSIVEHCIDNLKIPITEVGNDEDLFNLGMDSITSIKIVVAMEQEFDFEFEDEKLTMDTMRTINSLYEYLNQRLAQK